MFWKKSTKPVEPKISGKFSLGTDAVNTDVPPVGSKNPDSLSPVGFGDPVKVASTPSDRAATLANNRVSGGDAWSRVLGGGETVRASSHDRVRYVVPRGYTISSTTFVSESVRIDGELSGKALSASEVVVSSGGRLSAPFEGRSIVSYGEISAPVDVAEIADLRSGTIVSAPVRAGQLHVEQGVRLLGAKLRIGS